MARILEVGISTLAMSLAGVDSTRQAVPLGFNLACRHGPESARQQQRKFEEQWSWMPLGSA